MPEDLPIACSLSATELPRRLAEMAALGGTALVGARVGATRAQLRFVAGTGVRERLSALVAAEAQCCAFLTMRLTDEPEAVVLTIDVPVGADLALAEFVGAFSGRPQAG